MTGERTFRDRPHAGRILGEHLAPAITDPNPIVLALPRGGVPVGVAVARTLRADLDIFLVRKLGVPGREELAMGAIASGGTRVLSSSLIRQLEIPETVVDQVTWREREEIERRELLYRNGRKPLPVRGRTAILVDDGLATGATMLAAVLALRQQDPKQIVVAVPVASRDACEQLREHADQLVCVETPEPFHAVGEWYDDFFQISDLEVEDLLAQAAQDRRQ